LLPAANGCSTFDQKGSYIMDKFGRFSIITGTLLCTAAPAIAQVTTEYPGTFCQEVADLTPEAVRWNLGQTVNQAAGTNELICPAIQQAGRVLRARVFVRDMHPNQNVECRVQSKDSSGVVGWWSPLASSAGVNTNFQINLAALGGYNTPGVKFINCTVPGASGGEYSGINSYGIVEQ
jgi:hypothetical protein